MVRGIRSVLSSVVFRYLFLDSYTSITKLKFPNAALLPCIYIDPAKVRYKCNIRGVYARGNNLFRDGDWDKNRKPFSIVEDTDPRYLSCRDLLDRGRLLEETLEYKEMLSRLERNGKVRGMTHAGEILEYLNDVRRLYLDIKKDGRIMTQRELGAAAHGGEINFAVGRDGELMKTDNGNHRFAIARALDIKRVPVQISVVHSEQLEEIQKKYSGSACDAINQYFLDIQARYS